MAKGKGGLGRGLESLFEDAAPSLESDAKIETLPLREIEPDPDQPRKTFDEEALGSWPPALRSTVCCSPLRCGPRDWAATASWPASAGGVPAAWPA